MAISTCTVKAYLNTGCSLNNIPDSPARLNSFATSVVTLDVLNCLPLSGKPAGSVTVKAFSGLDEADYLSLQFSLDGTTIYATNLEYEYISLDTVIISYVVDAWLTAGGISNISAISGLTERHHVSDDTWGKYCMDDEYIIPSEPLVMYTEAKFDNTGYGAGSAKKVVASTINLYETGRLTTGLAYTYRDNTTGAGTDDKVTCPHVIPFNLLRDGGANINWKVGIGAPSGTLHNMPSITMGYYDGDDENVKAGIAKAQELGIEGGIIASYLLPNDYASSAMLSSMGMWTFGVGNNGVASEFIDGATTDSHMAFEDGSSLVQNKRLLYGRLRSYGMAAMATGESVEFKPEDIRQGSEAQPLFVVYVDPREDGRPYFRFKSVFGDDSNFNHIIRGQSWANAPISWQQASGRSTAMMRFKNQTESELNSIVASRQRNNIDAWAGVGSNLQNATIGGAMAGGLPGAAAGMAAGMASSVVNIAAYNAKADISFNEYKKNRQIELENMLISGNVVAPTVAFPNDAIVRDIAGNGVLFYHYDISPNDKIRCDKILNAFGYKVVEPLEKSFFTNRARYNYVKASDIDISFSSPVSRRWKDLAIQQIQGGIRIWHVRPDCNFTTTNAVV